MREYTCILCQEEESVGSTHPLVLAAFVQVGWKERRRIHPPVSSVADPDPSDPYVFGPPGSGSGSGSISQRGMDPGSGYFYHQSKIVKKTLIPIVFLTSF